MKINDFVALEIETAHPDDAKELVKIEVLLLQVLLGKEYTREKLKAMIVDHWHWKREYPEEYAEYEAYHYRKWKIESLNRDISSFAGEAIRLSDALKFALSYETAGKTKRGVTVEHRGSNRAMRRGNRIWK